MIKRCLSVSHSGLERKTDGPNSWFAFSVQNSESIYLILTTTTIEVDVAKYPASPTGKLHSIYMNTPGGLRISLLTRQETAAIDSQFRQGVELIPKLSRTFIDDIVLKEEHEAEQIPYS